MTGITPFVVRRAWTACVLMMFVFMGMGAASAARTYTPSEVFAETDYANRMVNSILAIKGIEVDALPRSMEHGIKPMHVYELYVSVLMELYSYALNTDRQPPPVAMSTPISYTPTDVYYLSRLATANLEELYRDAGGVAGIARHAYTNKTPPQVYQSLFELYYKLNLLNGKRHISPNEVYAHTYRAKEDLQLTLLTLSRRLQDEDKQRLLVTATYGMHPDASTLSAFEPGRKPADVLDRALAVRAKLNRLRKYYGLAEIPRPARDDFAGVKPIDVFLQTQFIIAELNLLKIPLEINSTTNSPKQVADKGPSDVYQQMKHIEYMLDRVLALQ